MERFGKMKDYVVRATAANAQIRAFACSTRETVETARQAHNTSPVITAALGRLLSAGIMMGSMLKSEKDLLTLQIRGEGPVRGLTVTADAMGHVKGYPIVPDVILPANAIGKLDVAGAVGPGTLTVIKDMHLREPYVGQVNLVSGEIAEDFAMYFTASEQTPSLVSLGVLVSDQGIEAAGGLIVQMMPGASEAAIQSIENSAGMFMDISGTMKEYHLDGAVNQLLLHLEPEILERRDTRYACDCSRERVERALITLGPKELNDMISEQHGAQVDCHFCNKRYAFSEDELKALLAAATAREDQ